MKERLALFDALKMMAICMVVFWHTLDASRLDNTLVVNFIIGCNMPIFFFTSGYFLWKTIDVGDWKKLGRHLLSYFLPFTVLSVVLSGFSPIVAMKRFVFAGWFVWVLATVYVFCFLARRLTRNPKEFLVVSCALAFGLLFVEGYKGIIYNGYTRSMFPYFAIGCVFRMYDFRPWDKKKGLLCLILYLMVVCFEGSVRTNGLGFYWSETTYRALYSFKDSVLLILRPANGMLGVIGLLYVVNLLSCMFGDNFDKICRWGGGYVSWCVFNSSMAIGQDYRIPGVN